MRRSTGCIRMPPSRWCEAQRRGRTQSSDCPGFVSSTQQRQMRLCTMVGPANLAWRSRVRAEHTSEGFDMKLGGVRLDLRWSGLAVGSSPRAARRRHAEAVTCAMSVSTATAPTVRRQLLRWPLPRTRLRRQAGRDGHRLQPSPPCSTTTSRVADRCPNHPNRRDADDRGNCGGCYCDASDHSNQGAITATTCGDRDENAGTAESRWLFLMSRPLRFGVDTPWAIAFALTAASSSTSGPGQYPRSITDGKLLAEAVDDARRERNGRGGVAGAGRLNRSSPRIVISTWPTTEPSLQSGPAQLAGAARAKIRRRAKGNGTEC